MNAHPNTDMEIRNMARVDIPVKQSDITALRMTSTQAILNGAVLDFRVFAGCITLNTLLDAEGNNYNRRDMANWTQEKLFGTPVIAALCGSIKDARELNVNLDTYYFKMIVKEDTPAPVMAVPENPYDKVHLLATMQLLKGKDSFYRVFKGSMGPVKLDDLDVVAMIQNGGVEEVLVRVMVGSLTSYVPFTSIAANLPTGSGEAFNKALSTLIGSMIATALMQRRQ